MEKYEKYKDSGIEWIGKIPENWESKRIKYIISYQKGRNPKDLKIVWNDNFEIYLAMDYLRDNPKQVYFVEDPENYVLVNENDILLLWDGSNAGEFIKSKKGILSSTMAVLYLVRIQKEYSYYFLKTFEKYLKESTIGMGIPHVNGEEFKNSLIAIPTDGEQTTIATFLDRKTAEIDRIIANKQKLIALYEEEKQAIINQAVTKGLDPNVTLKDSGVEWLGEIPKHWEIKKLKYIIKINSGEGIKSDDIKPIGDYPVYGGNGIAGYTNTFNSKNDDIIIGRVGAKCGNVRLVYDEKWISDNALVASIISDIDIYFLTIQLQLMDLNNMANQNAQPLITGTMVKNSFIAVPNKNEQFEIVKSLNSECNQIETIIAKFNKQIGLLKEYRTTLISEVVTGKIMVTENENK